MATTTRNRLLVVIFLIVITVMAYWQVRGLLFVTYDDREYITENFRVQAGLSWGNILWTSTAVVASHWAPVTLLSHMAACQVFGLKPEGHHLVNLALHIANVLLLFWVLQLATGLLWRSAFVAAIFALHPLNVESVAWVAERKNVLSTFFLLLTIWAYVHYTRSPGWRRYVVVLACFTLGLMSKPMLVTVPFLLLLLDYWPLARWKAGPDAVTRSMFAGKQSETAGQAAIAGSPDTREPGRWPLHRLLLEKAPLLLLTVFSCVMTMRSIGDTLYSPPVAPLRSQFSNAIISYVVYLYKCIWPTRLAVFYPFQKAPFAFWEVAVAAAGLTAMSVIALLMAAQFKFVVCGWFWYLVSLAPVIGFIQAGYQSRADRYAYVPLIGIFIILVWTAAEVSNRVQLARLPLLALGGCILAIMITLTVGQVSFWHDSVTLFHHAEQVTSDNYIAYSNLGYMYMMSGDLDDAAAEYSRTDPSDPTYADAQENLGVVSLRKGEMSQAIDHLKTAIEVNPRSFEAYNRLGIALANAGQRDQAADCFRKALAIKPDQPSAYANMGSIAEQKGDLDESSFFYEKAIDLIRAAQDNGNNSENGMAESIHLRLAELSIKRGDLNQAKEHFNAILRLDPNSAAAREGVDRVSNLMRGAN
ncbi:MAG TPA: tetratricopeptide repeat protein [Blastocatellia bacterium]